MSIESMLAENTAAIRELIAAINATQTALQSPGARAYAEAKALVLEPAEPAPAVEPEKKPKRSRVEKSTPAVTEPTPVNLLPDFDRPVPDGHTPTSYIRAEPEPVVEVTYDDIKVPFLTQLVAKKGRDAGAALLREFGVQDGGKLSDIPKDRWAAVLASIALAVNS